MGLDQSSQLRVVIIMKRRGAFFLTLVPLLLQALIVSAQDCSAPCAITCPKNIEPCCLSKERALAEVDDCGCSTRCGKCHVPEGFPCDPSIDVCQTGTKCVLNPSSNDTTLGIGPIHQCMDKMTAIMTKAPQKLEALEKEMKDEMGEDAPMYQTIGKIAKMFMEQISQAKDSEFNDYRPMEEALQCNDMMEEPTLVDNSLKIVKGAVEKDFAPKGFVDRTMGVIGALEAFIQATAEHKFDLQNLEPVLKAASAVQPDIEEMAGKIGEMMPEEEEDEWHEDWDKHEDGDKHEDWDKHEDGDKHEDWDKHEDLDKHEDGDKKDDDYYGGIDMSNMGLDDEGMAEPEGDEFMPEEPSMGDMWVEDPDNPDAKPEDDSMKPDMDRYEEDSGTKMETAPLSHEDASKSLENVENDLKNGSPASSKTSICWSVIALLIIGLML